MQKQQQLELSIPKYVLRLITIQILVFCGYYIFVAFKLSGNPLEINTYPFSSWGMFSEIRDVRPYSVHKPYDESGVKWEVVLNEPFRSKEEMIQKKLMWTFLQHRSLAAKPEIDRPKIDAVVKQAVEFVTQFVDNPRDVRAVRMYHAFFRVPPYPAEPVLGIASERLLGEWLNTDNETAPQTAGL